MTHSSAIIQIAPESAPTIPPWMGEVAAVAQVLTHIGLLRVIQDQVRFVLIARHFPAFFLPSIKQV
jgi:hypothetical protein